jgi:DUF1009 family protein
MKLFFLKIAYRLGFLKKFKKMRVFKKANEELEKYLREREVNRIILKGTIIKMVRKYLRADALSKYIPKDRKNNTEIKERILAEFGDRMKSLGIRITDNLELK